MQTKDDPAAILRKGLIRRVRVQYLDTETPQNNNKKQHKKNPADSGVSDML